MSTDHVISRLYLPWYKAAVPCCGGSTSARLEQLPAWTLWPHKPYQAWALPAPPRCTAPGSPAGGHHPGSPPRWREAAAGRTARGTTRRRRFQHLRGLPPTSRCSPLSRLDGRCNILKWEKSKKQKQLRDQNYPDCPLVWREWCLLASSDYFSPPLFTAKNTVTKQKNILSDRMQQNVRKCNDFHTWIVWIQVFSGLKWGLWCC